MISGDAWPYFAFEALGSVQEAAVGRSAGRGRFRAPGDGASQRARGEGQSGLAGRPGGPREETSA